MFIILKSQIVTDKIARWQTFYGQLKLQSAVHLQIKKGLVK